MKRKVNKINIVLERARFASENLIESLVTTNSHYYVFFRFNLNSPAWPTG